MNLAELEAYGETLLRKAPRVSEELLHEWANEFRRVYHLREYQPPQEPVEPAPRPPENWSRAQMFGNSLCDCCWEPVHWREAFYAKQDGRAIEMTDGVDDIRFVFCGVNCWIEWWGLAHCT